MFSAHLVLILSPTGAYWALADATAIAVSANAKISLLKFNRFMFSI